MPSLKANEKVSDWDVGMQAPVIAQPSGYFVAVYN
jgi:hypothetical protein